MFEVSLRVICDGNHENDATKRVLEIVGPLFEGKVRILDVQRTEDQAATITGEIKELGFDLISGYSRHTCKNRT